MSIKKALLAIIVLAFTYTGKAQTLGDYKNVLDKFEYYYNNQHPDSIFTLFSDTIQKIMPLNKTIESFSTIYTQYGEIRSYKLIGQSDSFISYKTDFRIETFTLLIALNKENKILTLRFTPYKDSSKIEKSNFHVDTKNGTLYATMATPHGITKYLRY